MNKEIAKIWCNTLRSGKYEQGRRLLHNKAQNTFCCLGVLCDLAVKAGVKVNVEVNVEEDSRTEFVTYDSAYNTLPKSVQKWAGLCNEAGRPKNDERLIALWELNDLEKRSFDEIANYIEEHVEEL